MSVTPLVTRPHAKKVEREFSSSDEDLINGLIMMRHRPVRNDLNDQRQLVCVFDESEVLEAAQDLLTGGNPNFCWQDYLFARAYWRMNLRFATGRR